MAEQRAAGKISEAITQIYGFGTIGAKTALKAVESAAGAIAKRAINAKKANKYVNPKNKNIKKELIKQIN